MNRCPLPGPVAVDQVASGWLRVAADELAAAIATFAHDNDEPAFLLAINTLDGRVSHALSEMLADAQRACAGDTQARGRLMRDVRAVVRLRTALLDCRDHVRHEPRGPRQFANDWNIDVETRALFDGGIVWTPRPIDVETRALFDGDDVG